MVDPTGERASYILDEDQMTSTQVAADRLSKESLHRLQALIADGDASPDVAVDVAESRIMQMAREADARHAQSG